MPLQSVMTSKTGTVNNVIQVKRTDFEVFDALKVDSQDSGFSGAHTRMKSFRAALRRPKFRLQFLFK